MPTASYIEQNNYDLVKDIRPFDMPYDATMKEIAVRTQYWKAGADRIKSVYDQAVGLNPQYTQGKEYLKEFVTQATKNLDKISKSDLSILDNSQQAVTVFKPLFDVSNPFNAALLKDSQLNEFYQKQQQLADTYRTKDGGKEWNVNNERYFRDGQAKYQQDAQNGDYSTIDSNYQNRKSFIPYYDYKKELSDIQEMCKGYSQETQDVASNSMYFKKDSIKGCDPKRLALAFQTGLSDRAKQQMHIDGYNHFKGNEDVLLRKFNDISINNADQEIKAIEGAIAGLEAGGVTAKEKEKIEYFQSILAVKKPRFEASKKEYEKLTAGNPLDYVQKNYEKLAGTVYFDELTNSLGESFRTDDTKSILTPNAVAMQHQKFLQETATQLRGFQHDKDMAAVDWMYKEKELTLKAQADMLLARLKGELSGESAATPTVMTPNVMDPKTAPSRTEQDFKEKELVPAQAEANTSYKTLTDYITKKYPKVSEGEAMTQFLNEHNGKDKKDQDPTLARLYKQFEESSNKLKSKINTVEAVNEELKSSHPELFNNSNLDNEKKRVNVIAQSGAQFGSRYEGIEISEKDMFNILQGQTVNGVSYRTVPGVGAQGGKMVKKLFYNNMELKVPTVSTDPNKDIYNLLGSSLKKQGDNVRKINELKTSIYTDNWYSNGNITKNTVTIKKDGKQDQDIRAMLGVGAGQGEKNGYVIVAQTSTGEGIYVQKLDENAKPITSTSKKDVELARIGGFGAENTIEDLPMGSAYKLYGISTRYSGIGTDAELSKYKGLMEDIKNVRMIFNASKLAKSSNYVGSEELPGGRGVVTAQTNTGRPVNITVRKEGDKIIYVANIKTGQGYTPIEASTPVELVTIINSN